MKLFKNKWWLPLLILLVGGFLRLYRIEETLMFQGDQGRDALVVKRMLYGHDLTLLGPVTSVGNMYLGPFYYYFMAPWLAFTYPDPIGSAVGVAFLDLATLGLIYFVANKFWGRANALIAMGLYAVLEVVLIYSRFSWNPNIAPFFGLLTYYFSVRYAKEGKKHFLWWATLSLAILAQSHYVALLAGAMPLTVLAYRIVAHRNAFKDILAAIGGSMGLILITTLPLIIFNVRHNNIIWNGFASFLGGDKRYLMESLGLGEWLRRLHDSGINVIIRLVGIQGRSWEQLLLMVLLFGGFILVRKVYQDKMQRPSTLVLLVWVLAAVMGVALYSESVYDHYLTFVFPGLVLFYAWLIAAIYKTSKAGKWVGLVVTLIIVSLNLIDTPGFKKGGPPASFYQEMVAKIVPNVPSARYNLALIADNKDYRGMNYRYFFEVSQNPPQHEENYENLEYLVVIDEKETKEPTELEIFEIQAAGPKELVYSESLIPGLQAYIYKVR